MEGFATAAGALGHASPFAAQPLAPPASTHTPAAPNHLGSSLFVKGLGKGVNERQLHAIFSAFGSVVDCQVARHRSGRSAGFAVVSFFRREDAQRALLVMESAVLAGRRLNVRPYTPELQQSSIGLGDINVAQALAAMLEAANNPPAMTPQQQQQQLMVQQLATAVAAQQQRTAAAGALAHAASGPLLGTALDPWAALSMNNQAFSPRLVQQSLSMGAHSSATAAAAAAAVAAASMSGSNALPKSGVLPAAWHDVEPQHQLITSQLDSWARHSVDTSAPNYGPRRRSNATHGPRLSLEGLDLSGCGIGAALAPALEQEPSLGAAPAMHNGALSAPREPSTMSIPTETSSTFLGMGQGPRALPSGEHSKWSVPRSGSSADSSLPLSSPQDQSEDGTSVAGRSKRGLLLMQQAAIGGMGAYPPGAGEALHGGTSGYGAGMVHLAGIASEEDGSELGDPHASSSSLQLPVTLDGDGLFDKPSVPNSSLTSLRSSNTSVTAIKLKHSTSALPTVFGVPSGHMGGPGLPQSAMASPGGQLRAPGMAPPAPGERSQMELAALALSQLTSQLNLEGAGVPGQGGANLGGPGAAGGNSAHVEAAMRQAQQADHMIAQLSAMRSQALLAYHAALQQQPPGPAAGAHGFMSSRPSLMGTTALLPQAASPAMGTPRSSAAATLNTAGSLEAVLAASGLSAGQLDLGSLSALLSLQQSMQQQNQHHM